MVRLRRAVWIGVLLLTTVIGLSAQVKDLPDGWIRAGSKPAEYEMGVDAAAGRTGGAAFIKSRTATPSPDGFGTVMQQFIGAEYRGKRLRLSAYIKAAGISNWAGLWMRVDGPASTPTLAFDNMENRPIKGTQEWRRYDIVLDVPPTATNIAFGVLLAGAGQAWLDDLQFEVVGANVPSTDMVKHQPLGSSGPLNLNFDK